MPSPPESGTLLLVRHGQSRWNLDNRFAGWVDVPLTPEGEVEARRAAGLLRPFHLDRACSSTLVRARETLRIILDTLGQSPIPVEASAALNERHYGQLQGLNRDDAVRRFGAEQVRLWRRSYRIRPPGGESLEDTAARVLPYYRQRVEPHVLAGETVLVVAHGSTLRALVMSLDGLSEQAIECVEIPTGRPLRYQLSPGGAVLEKGYLEESPDARG